MKIKYVILIIFLAFLKAENSHSQHSENFIKLTKQVKPIDSITKIKKFRNGKTKKISKFLVYEYGEYTYEIMSGKQQLIDKKGSVFFEQVYDNFGNLLFKKHFNSSKQMYKLIQTTRIDLKSESTVYDILNWKRKLITESYEKEFNSNKKEGKLKLWKEGKRINGKKVGIWKIYNFCDENFEEKNYK